MTIASELIRVQTAKASIKTAIEAKGVTVPTIAKLDAYNTYINSIVTGGGGSGWQPPTDWIDISNVANNEINILVGDFGVGVGFRVTTSAGNYSIDWGDGTVETGRVSGTTYQHQYVYGSGTPCSLGYTTFKIRIYGATGTIARFEVQKHTYTLTAPQYPPYLDVNFGTLGMEEFSNAFFVSSSIFCRSLKRVKIGGLASAFGSSSMFYGAYALASITLPTSWGNVANCYQMFYQNYALTSITLPASWGSVTDCSSMFYQNYALASITLPASWGSVIDCSSMFYQNSALASITLPTSWGNVIVCSSMFYQNYALTSITLPASWGSVTNCSSMFYQNSALKTINNLEFLGSQTANCNMTDIFFGCDNLQQPILINSRLSAFGALGASGKLLKLTSIRLPNQNSTFTGSSPQINVSYTSMPTADIELLFSDIPNGLSSKTVSITGTTGATTLISKTASGTTAGSNVITMANTTSLAVGMEITGAGINGTTGATFDGTANTFTITGTPALPNGKAVSFSAIVTTTGLTANTTYYVVNGNQLALTPGGAAIDFTNNGTGTVTRYYPVITAINPNVSITIDVNCTATASVTAICSTLKRSIALLKGWTVTG